MNKITDEEIRDIAEQSGFWGVEIWWKHYIPSFRKFLELAIEKDNKPNESSQEIDQSCQNKRPFFVNVSRIKPEVS